MASAGIEYWCTSSSDFSNSAGPNNDNKLSAGSIAGAGSYYPGANELTVGSNNLPVLGFKFFATDM
jgi:hypothetical protein